MLPKLSPLQWLLVAAFLFFYGFTVFALTRDYYLRQPLRPVTVAPNASDQAEVGQRMRAALDQEAGNIPPEVIANDPRLLSQEADRLFVARRFDEAVPLYRRLLELTPGDVEIENDLGLALHYMGDSTAAVQVLRTSAEAAPQHQRIWLSLGFVAAQVGDGQLATEALTRARNLDPGTDIGAEAERLLDLL